MCLCPLSQIKALKLLIFSSLETKEKEKWEKEEILCLTEVLQNSISCAVVRSANSSCSKNISWSPWALSLSGHNPTSKYDCGHLCLHLTFPFGFRWFGRQASGFIVCLGFVGFFFLVNRKLTNSLCNWGRVKIVHGLLSYCFDNHCSIDSDSSIDLI